MKSVVGFIKREPAMVVTVILAIMNMFVQLTEAQTDSVRLIVESLIVLLGGAVIRQNVTPVAKLSNK